MLYVFYCHHSCLLLSSSLCFSFVFSPCICAHIEGERSLKYVIAPKLQHLLIDISFGYVSTKLKIGIKIGNKVNQCLFSFGVLPARVRICYPIYRLICSSVTSRFVPESSLISHLLLSRI